MSGLSSKEYPVGVGAPKSRWIDGILKFFRGSDGGEIYSIDPTNRRFTGPGIARTERFRFSATQVNNGATVLPAVPGYKYRIHDLTLISIGGAAAGATDVRLLGTRAAASVAIVAAAVAGLTQSTLARLGASNIAALADGASNTELDAGTAVTIGKTGGSLTGSTNIDVLIAYELVAA